MRAYWLLPAISLWLVSCATSSALQYEAVADNNVYHIAILRKGMSERQVLQIMRRPFSYESFEVGDDIYDVWFYVTRPTGLDQTRMVPQNLTPLTFKNGVLVGTGYNWYYYAMKEQAAEIEAERGVGIRDLSQEEKEKAFEKKIRKAPTEEKKSPKNDTTEAKGLQKALNVPKGEKKAPQQKPLPKNVHIISQQKDILVPLSEGDKKPLTQREKLSKLAIGMSEEKVLSIMGDPDSKERVAFGKESFEVLFYETLPSKSGRRSMIPQHKTPLIFKNDLLISMDEDLLFNLKQKAMEEKELSQAQRPMPSTISKKDFSSIKKKMSEKEVLSRLREPEKKEILKVGKKNYEAWIYSGAEGESFPILFQKGKVYSKSPRKYRKLRKKAIKQCPDCFAPKLERMQEDEAEQNFNYW